MEGDYGPQICTSQWGYDYLCLSTTPMLSLSLTGFSPTLALPQTFINQQVQASFVVWNSGGGRLTGTVSVPAPFSIVSGGSFSLLPGQPQEVVVRFSSGTAGSFSRGIAISSNGGNATVTVSGASYENHFLGELQRDATLRVGMLYLTDAFRTGFFFEPFSAQPLYFWYHFDWRHQELLTTIQFGRDRLQGRVKFLRAPVGEVNCPILLLSDFEDQQKLQTAYQCLVDAGVRVEISLQFNDYSVTLPQLLSSESDYAAVQEAMRQIAMRVEAALSDKMEAFKSAFLNDETVQILSRCVLGNVTQPTNAKGMVPLGGGCSRIDSCFECLGGMLGVGGGWRSFLAAAFIPGGPTTAVAIKAIQALIVGSVWGWKTVGEKCPTCIGGCGNPSNTPPPPPGGGGCSRCPNNSFPTPG